MFYCLEKPVLFQIVNKRNKIVTFFRGLNFASFPFFIANWFVIQPRIEYTLRVGRAVVDLRMRLRSCHSCMIFSAKPEMKNRNQNPLSQGYSLRALTIMSTWSSNAIMRARREGWYRKEIAILYDQSFFLVFLITYWYF